MKFAIVLHQKAFPEEISFTKFTNFGVTFSTPENQKKNEILTKRKLKTEKKTIIKHEKSDQKWNMKKRGHLTGNN